MAKIQLVTDSTSGIPTKFLKKFKIESVPINIIWDGQTFADGIDLQREEFFERMRTSYHVPSTAAPSPRAFGDAFDRMGEKGESILAILMSRELSSTIQTAEIAAKHRTEKDIHIWDSGSISMGLGFQVLLAARAIAKGADLVDVMDLLRQTRQRTGVLLTVESLDYLRRGGRLSRSQYLMANAIGYRPILEVRGGPMTASDRGRSQRAVWARMIDLVEERSGGERPLRLAVGYTDNIEEGQAFAKQIERELKPEELIFFPVSQANSVHGGSGTLGLSYLFGV